LGSQDSKAVPMRKWHQSGYSVAFCSIRKWLWHHQYSSGWCVNCISFLGATEASNLLGDY
jgi:hypothetical protein